MKKYYSLFTLVLLLSAQTLLAQRVVCENGKAGEYECKDYDLLSRVSLSQLDTTHGNDCWGWTDPETNIEYAIMCTRNSTVFVNISDPINPIIVGTLETSAGSSSWRDAKVYNNHVYIVADAAGDHGMQVFDLTKLRGSTGPKTLKADKVFKTTGVGSCHNIVINEEVGIAYLVGCSKSQTSGGPVMVDISDPKNPKALSTYRDEGYTHDAQVVTYNGPDEKYKGKQIYFGGNESKIVILDASNPSNLKTISTLRYDRSNYAHQGGVTEDHKYFIFGDELDEGSVKFNTRTIIFDVSDLDNPKLSSTYYGKTKATDHNGYVKGDSFFLANYRAGLRELNIRNIAGSSNPMTEVAFFDSDPTGNSSTMQGAWSVYPYFKSGVVLISDTKRGLFMVRRTGTFSTEEVEAMKKSYSLLPNPTSSTATLRADETNPINSIEIYNVLGQKVFSKNNLDTTEFELPTKSYSKGLYLVNINKNVTKKLVIK